MTQTGAVRRATVAGAWRTGAAARCDGSDAVEKPAAVATKRAAASFIIYVGAASAKPWTPSPPKYLFDILHWVSFTL